MGKKRTKMAMRKPPDQPKKQSESHHVSPMITIKCTDLPSKGLPYPVGSEASYRPLTFGEVSVLAESKMSHSKNMDFLLEGIETSFDEQDLTLSDFLYLCLLRKMSTCETPKVQSSKFCTSCRKKSIFVFDIHELDFHDLKAEKLPITLNKEIEFAPITISKYKELVTLGKEEDPVYVLAAACISMNLEDAHEMAYNSTASRAKTLQKIDELLYHGVKPYTYKCGNKVDDVVCGNEISVSLLGGEGDLKPFRDADSTDEDVIEFG